jgi:hypothetical protein
MLSYVTTINHKILSITKVRLKGFSNYNFFRHQPFSVIIKTVLKITIKINGK